MSTQFLNRPLRKTNYLAFVAGIFIVAGTATAWAETSSVMVGAARVEVTPREPVVLAGYGGRTGEFEGIDTKLWARAMVIGETEPVAVVVLDNCGVPADVTARLAKRLAKRGLTPERLVVAATHTHNAPNLEGYAPILWAERTTPEQDERTAAYTAFAIERMEAAVAVALDAREPMHLEWAQGRATFGGNRRVIRDGTWAGFGFQRNGPVDHSLPMLAARDAGGKVRVLWVNYACHCTTVGGRNHVSGDWAGFANESMEEQFPEAIALMTIGCGADVGSQPSGSLEVAAQHGRRVGVEVRRLLAGRTTQLTGIPAVASTRIQLPLTDPKPREYWEEQRAKEGFHHELAKTMLERLDGGGSIPSEVDYPLSVWKFGDDLAIVFLAGEVVVDYSVRLNRELDWSRLWISAWANEMPGYIPSKRVLAEGGYEADFSQIFSGQPGRYKPGIEDLLVRAVRDLIGDSFTAAPGQQPAPFHQIPSGEPLAFERLAAWAAAEKTGDEESVLRHVLQYAGSAGPAIGRMTDHDGEQTEWNNFAGDFVERVFIRQQAKGAKLAWNSPALGREPTEPTVLCFTGGVGWISEPATEGFALLLGGEEKLRFDVTRAPARWASEDGAVELVYLPTWTSDVDSGGFFFLALSRYPLNPDGSIPIAVRSTGEGSMRWFAIDRKQDITAKLKKLSAVLDPMK